MYEYVWWIARIALKRGRYLSTFVLDPPATLHNPKIMWSQAVNMEENNALHSSKMLSCPVCAALYVKKPFFFYA